LPSNGSPHPIQQKLNGVVDRMESITKQLRFFIKPGEEKMERVVLNEVIAGALELMQHDFSHGRGRGELRHRGDGGSHGQQAAARAGSDQPASTTRFTRCRKRQKPN
jgi:hypothetical protein